MQFLAAVAALTEEGEMPTMTVSHKPTMSLRFLARPRLVSTDRNGENTYTTERILQQLFVPEDWSRHDEEWRDVPLVQQP